MPPATRLRASEVDLTRGAPGVPGSNLGIQRASSLTLSIPVLVVR
jgi:hypothetical protein